MSKELINPATLFPSVAFGFSHAVVASGSRIVSISGQVAWNAQMQLMGDTLAEQAKHALKNVQNAVEASGGALSDIVALRIYIVERAKTNIRDVGPILVEVFGSNPPASTWIGVSFLAAPDFLIEIEAMAVLP